MRGGSAASTVTLRALGAVAVLSAGLVAVLGVTGSSPAMAVGAGAAGLVALVSGTALLLRSRAGREDGSFLLWVGAALTVWGLGEVVQALIAAFSTPSFPTLGDLLSYLAAPLAVVGVLKIPRRRPPVGVVRPVQSPGPGQRLAVDSALLAVSGSLLAWQFGFVDALTAQRVSLHGVDSIGVLLVLLADMTVAALAFLLATRDLDRAMLVVAVGAGCYALGDMFTLHGIVAADRWPWQGAMLWCLAWPLIAGGLLRYDPTTSGAARRDRDPQAEPEARVVLATTVIGVLLLAAGMVFVLVTPTVDTDPTSVVMVVAALGVLGFREWLNARGRAGMIGRLHEEATTDPLTGLGNRRVLVDRVAAARSDGPASLVAVDLDGFKEVNDLLGHPTGDALLVAVARRIVEAVPDDAVVCRSGGDEFAVLVRADVMVAAAVGERLVAAVRRAAADVPGAERVVVSASVGVAPVSTCPAAASADPDRCPEGADGGPLVVDADPLAALSEAGAAQRSAKQSGRDRVVVYDEAAAGQRRRRLRVEERLRAAVGAASVHVAFQPIVDLGRGEVTGAEALARWTDAELGVVDPAEFIPVAEDSGLVVALGELVLQRTLEEMARHDLVGRGIRVSVNVSPVQLRVPGFHQVVVEALAAHRVPAASLVVEVTEAVFVDEDGPAVSTLRRLADAGVTIAIDDFGTGYSALGYLRRLPAHLLKVDRSLTSAIAEEPQARAIVAAVLELGRTMGLAVVVEGVGDVATSELVTGLGAQYGQGALFGGALPAADLAATAAVRRASGRRSA